ncbi:hypothetical protein M434DRAFT_10313 [Hypoxylon sp. CO27-5]|nr:hypothetical protein M434DRAFT_10313 [Hypoxylon sp. CO27-5]
MVWSPWVHVTTDAGEEYERCHNSQGDALVSSLLQWGAEAYIPTGDESLSQEARPYISPLHHPFKISIPLFINAGSGEALYDSIKRFAQEMAEINGDRVRFHATSFAPHGLIHGHQSYGMTDQLNLAAEDAWRFLEHIE